MPLLSCTARTCVYNKDEYCSKGDILVEGRSAAAVLKSEAEIPCQMLHAMIVVVVPLMWTVRRRNVLLTEKKNVMQTKSRLQVLLPLEVLTQNVEALSWNDKEIKKTPGRLLHNRIKPATSLKAKSKI